jgi:DNA anti-recombination protein RmuC
MKREEREWREKLLNMEKKLAEKSEAYQQKIQSLQKQNASLSKQSKKSTNRIPDSSPSDSPLL